LGYSREELLGKSIADIHPKDSLLKVSKAFDYLADSERKLTPDIPVLRKGGAMFFADITASRLVINGRNCLAGFFTDVTDRVAMQAELHRYRNQLEEFVEARAQELHLTNQSLRTTVYAMDRVGIAVHWTDADTGQFLYANKFAAEMLGYTERELLALNVAEIDPTFRNHYFKAATETFRQKSCVQFESNNLTKDKRVVPVEVTLHFLAGNYSEPNRFIAFVRDITERKHIEGTVLRALEDAENANRAKSAFLANMSHEVRTPLNAIAGMAYLIRQSGLTAEQSDRFRKLEAASEHLLNIINSVLDIAKIEAGKFTLVQSSVQLKTIMRNVSSMLRDGAQAKHLNFTIQLDTFPDDLLGDSTRLQQCLLNYASNSIKFSEHGTVAMRAQLVRETDDAVLVRFEVEDDGIGIAADVLERLFNSFEQADISITRK
jgi:PAS domain S-box-containing protein